MHSFLWKPCGITPFQKLRWQLLILFSLLNWIIMPKSKCPWLSCWKDLMVLHSNTRSQTLSGFVFLSPSHYLDFSEVARPRTHTQWWRSRNIFLPTSAGVHGDKWTIKSLLHFWHGRAFPPRFPCHRRVMTAWISCPALIPLCCCNVRGSWC